MRFEIEWFCADRVFRFGRMGLVRPLVLRRRAVLRRRTTFVSDAVEFLQAPQCLNCTVLKKHFYGAEGVDLYGGEKTSSF